jgi:hypothetical protein
MEYLVSHEVIEICGTFGNFGYIWVIFEIRIHFLQYAFTTSGIATSSDDECDDSIPFELKKWSSRASERALSHFSNESRVVCGS